MPGAITVITIASVIVVTLSQLHPSLLFTNTTTTGGDTGAHIAMPKFLETLISHGRLTGWDPGWYDGFPLYTFYFTLPDVFIAVGGWVIPYDIAFKLGTIAGSVMLPVCAWACGRFFRLRPPLPTLLAAASLPFLFDYTFTIYGGNLFSTLAGEYAFSFSLSLAVLFLGLFACAVREGRHRGWAAFVLAVCVLSHIVPGMYALGGAVLLTVVELLPARWGIGDSKLLVWRNVEVTDPVPRTRTLWRAVSTVGIGLLLSGWWLVPFGLDHAYATSMGYTEPAQLRVPVLPRSRCLGTRPGRPRLRRRRGGAQPFRPERHRPGGVFGPRPRAGPAGQPVQRAAAAAVVHLRVPDGGLGLRHGLHPGRRMVAPAPDAPMGGRGGARAGAAEGGHVSGLGRCGRGGCGR